MERSNAPSARQESFALRARTRFLTGSKRERGCGAWSVQSLECDPWIEVRREHGSAKARWCGLMACGHIWTCPVCSQAKRSKRAALLDAAVRNLRGRWQMLTLTVLHHRGMSLEMLHAGMMRAWRRCRQGRGACGVQALWAAKVTASARAVEMPHGENGWHVHLHVFLRTDEWSEGETDTLREAYQHCVRVEMGDACVPNDTRALWWSDALDGADDEKRSAYLAKTSFEVSGLGKKTGKRGSLSPWQIARKASHGSQAHLRLWQEYYQATKGKRAFVLDSRAAEAGRRQLALDALNPNETMGVDGAEQTDDGVLLTLSQETLEPPVRVPVKTRDYQALVRKERERPAVLALVLRDVEREGLGALERWIVYAHQRPDHERSRGRASNPNVLEEREHPSQRGRGCMYDLGPGF